MSHPAAPPADPADLDLAARAARRGPADLADARRAFDAIAARHSRALTAFLAARVGGSDLDDCLQTVWLRAWEHLPTRFQAAGGHLRGWLFQIARNYLIDRGRRKRPDTTDNFDDTRDSRHRPQDDELIDREERAKLADCLGKLPTAMAELVRGRLGGEDYDELCPRLEIPVERAHRLFHQAKALLRDCVGEKRS